MIYRKGFKPILKNVEIKRIPDRKVAGSIIIPDQVLEDAFMRGRVVATGAGWHKTCRRRRADGKWESFERFIEHSVKPGDIVAFAESEKTMTQTMVNNHHIVPADRVWGIVEE